MAGKNYISLKRKNYRGSDPKIRLRIPKYNEDTAMLEAHVNEQIKNGKTGVFHYYIIANEVGLSLKRVRDILFQVGCGGGGFTISAETRN